MIRSLRPGELVPDGTPRRYVNAAGYVRLRWKLGTGDYVECYEHRVVDGRITTSEHVHHVNGDRRDNRPENLRPISVSEHLTAHGEERRTWDRDEAARMYGEGASTVEIGAVLGVSPATVSRGLRAHGVKMRGSAELQRLDIDCEVLTLHCEEGLRADGIAARLGLSSSPVRRVLREHGFVYRAGRRAAPGRAS